MAERDGLAEALVPLVTAAMMSGHACIAERAEEVKKHFYENPDCTGADMYHAALQDFPVEFLRIRGDLVDGLHVALAAEEATDG